MDMDYKDLLRYGEILTDSTTDNNEGCTRERHILYCGYWFLKMHNGEVVELKRLDSKNINHMKKIFPNIKEQMVAYNCLFSHAHINKCNLEQCVKLVDDKEELKSKKYNIELIKNCITKYFDSYVSKMFIACSYSEVAEKLAM